MKPKNLLRRLCIFLAAMAPAVTHAIVIEGNFKGVVTAAQDASDSDSDSNHRNIWNSDIVGETVSGSFWYDTIRAPGNTANPNTPNEAIYFSRSNWVGVTFHIGGETFDISYGNSANLPGMDVVDVVIMSDHTLAQNGDDSEGIGISDQTTFGDEANEYEALTGFLSFYEPVVNVLNGIGLEQQFHWIKLEDSLSMGNGFFETRSFYNGQYGYGMAEMNISEIYAKVRDVTAVPEPSTLLLFGLAFVVFSLRGRFFLHIATK